MIGNEFAILPAAGSNPGENRIVRVDKNVDKRVSSNFPMNLSEGPILPSQDILNEFEQGKFVLSNLAAKRARQLRDGAPPLIRMDSSHPLTVALAEIAQGKIRPIASGSELPEEPTDGDIIALDLDSLPAERGILLPALDETEVGAFGVGTLSEEEHDHEPEEEQDVAGPSLEDLLEDVESEPDIVAPESDEAPLSLTDIAEQESLDDEEEGTAD